jgi:hypothetical protein
MAYQAYFGIYLNLLRGQRIPGPPGWSFPIVVLCCVATVLVFVANYRRLEDRNERRRARVVMVGTVVLIVSRLPYVVHGTFFACNPRLVTLRGILSVLPGCTCSSTPAARFASSCFVHRAMERQAW